MAGSRKTGALGLHGNFGNVADGTLCRHASPRPGPLGTEQQTHWYAKAAPAEPRKSEQSVAAERAVKNALMPVLFQRCGGLEVERLQKLLNARLVPRPILEVDGIFGPKTQQAVAAFQKAQCIANDGIVWRLTWYHLVAEPNTRRRGATHSEPHRAATEIVAWSVLEKVMRVLELTTPKLPQEVRQQFRNFFTGENLVVAGGLLAAWAVSHVFGFGEAADVVLLGVGYIFLGKAAFDAGQEFGHFLNTTATAETEQDLDRAADHLAKAIVGFGIVTFLTMLDKAIRSRGGKAEKAGSEKPTSATKSEPASKAQQPAKPHAPSNAFAAMMQKVDALDFSTPPNKAVFYSGPGQGARAAAFAEQTGSMTIEMTPGGRALAADPVFKSLSPAEQYQVWQKASKPFAEGASGETNAFVKGARENGTFRTIEEPILKSNPKNKTTYHD